MVELEYNLCRIYLNVLQFYMLPIEIHTNNIIITLCVAILIHSSSAQLGGELRNAHSCYAYTG